MRGAGLRSRWPRWPVTLAVAGVIVAGGAAAVTVWPHALWWLIVVMLVAAAVTPPAVAALSQVLQRRQEISRAAWAGLQGTTGKHGGKLPTVRTIDLEARVHQTVLPIPYIHRDDEDTIRAHLGAGRPVLLIGPSMVGKTKMAARVVAEEFGSWPVAIPDSRTALADLDAKDVTLQGSVIWLDDIDRLIGADGVTDGALQRLAAAGNLIVGTIRARAYERFQPSDQLRLPEWDVLSVFEHVFISRDLSPREQQRLVDAIDDPDIRDRICTVGLGEYVGAARQVAEALELGAAGTDSLGYALVLAASAATSLRACWSTAAGGLPWSRRPAGEAVAAASPWPDTQSQNPSGSQPSPMTASPGSASPGARPDRFSSASRSSIRSSYAAPRLKSETSRSGSWSRPRSSVSTCRAASRAPCSTAQRQVDGSSSPNRSSPPYSETRSDSHQPSPRPSPVSPAHATTSCEVRTMSMPDRGIGSRWLSTGALSTSNILTARPFFAPPARMKPCSRLESLPESARTHHSGSH